MTAKWSEIEAAVVAALAPLRKTAGSYLRAVDLYAGEADDQDETDDDVRAKLEGRAPGVLVQADGSGVVTFHGNRRWVDIVEVRLLLVSGNLRSPLARKGGAGVAADADPGVHQMSDDTTAILAGMSSGVTGAGRLRYTGSQMLRRMKDLALMSSTYEVRVDRARPARTGADLTEIAGSVHAIVMGAGVQLGVEGAGVMQLSCAATDSFGFALTTATHYVVIEGAANEVNDGRFPVLSIPDAHTLRYTNAAGVDEDVFPGTWRVVSKPVAGVSLDPRTM